VKTVALENTLSQLLKASL